MNRFTNYIYDGFFHVLDINALDHILFFIALTVVFTFKNWKEAIWLITFFTIGHTLSFGLSVYDHIYIKSNIVEFLIPITIMIPLVVNIYNALKDNTVKKASMYFALFFGLIHGLGFSSYFLMRLDDTDAKFMPLLKFAIGIELAQIVVVFCIIALAYIFQQVFKVRKKIWIISVSLLVFIYIIPMIVERWNALT